ncbi:RecC [Desulfamplus magnetovallimortis]|uniref:RecC n=1 Tax=Desulfamplus magnetovallimortis TaxID=1246637 RepID=A0A1W1HE41_9BACT|nr:exodeoxyribonuclease V subunit gamma [Desulfamplus magnetovallimortis]SLM30703.1 RecC [Desulfamplus magnetovallimortis]
MTNVGFAEHQNDLPSGFSIIHSNHLETLRDVMVEWIRTHPLTPLENEIFLVQSNGMAQWLKLGFAADAGCGISAALDIQLPGRFMWQAYRAVLGDDEIPLSSAFEKEPLVWRLMRLMPELLSETCFAPLRRFLEFSDIEDEALQSAKDLLNESVIRKRYQLSRKLADLFDQYQVYRSDWLEAWADGDEYLTNSRGERFALPEEQLWQARMWSRIREDMPNHLRHTSRSEVHKKFMNAVKKLSSRPLKLPRRVIVFGISSLPVQVLELLHSLSLHCQVLLFVNNPCRHYWADIIENIDLLKIRRARHRRKEKRPDDLDPDIMHHHVNPLLASWGRQGRDYIGLLYGYDTPEAYQGSFAAIDIFKDVVEHGETPTPLMGAGLSADGGAVIDDKTPTLLQQVQQSVLDLEPLPDKKSKKKISKRDRSVMFQLTHSRQREVEVLQDNLLKMFECNPELTPRDIIVMTPDIDAYAPYISGVFGNILKEDNRYIPFSIADNPESRVVPFLLALERLLGLPDCRMTSGEFMELLEVRAFRQRFSINSGDLPVVQRWLADSGICWGLDSNHRQNFDLPGGLEENTWLFGLRRMLLGYATGAGESWRGIEPYDEIGGLEAALAGHLASVIERLVLLWKELQTPTTPELWALRIRELVKQCFEPSESRDLFVVNQLNDILDRWISSCRDASFQEPLSLSVAREYILGEMTEYSISQRFLAGMVNFCTLMPMRAIPFKVVCLLGMNDGDFPRSHPPLDFDLMAIPGCFRPGDRSRRDDDRYLFLEALLSARETLYISYIGRSIKDNSERMPSVLVGQLRDYLESGWSFGSEAAGDLSDDIKISASVLEHISCQHPLQPFSRAYFNSKKPDSLFTYAREWRDILESDGIGESGSKGETGESGRKGESAETGRGVETEDSGAILNGIEETRRCGMKNRSLPHPQFEGDLQAAGLIRFMKNPVQFFFNQRLKIYFDDVRSSDIENEPFALDNLSPFQLGSILLGQGVEACTPVNPDIKAAQRAILSSAQSLLRTGCLPMKSGGVRALKQLVEPVNVMLENHYRLCINWPQPCDALEVRLPFSFNGCGCDTLEDWLDRLFCKEQKYGRWEFYHGNITDGRGKITRPYSFVGLWVKHLEGAASGLPLKSYLVAHDAVAGFLPVESEMAKKWLLDIIGLWWQGMSLPLPVTARTGMLWQQAFAGGQGDDLDPEKHAKVLKSVRKKYEGDGYASSGELGFSPYLKRVYPDFESLWSAFDNSFDAISEKLYRPLLKNLQLH